MRPNMIRLFSPLFGTEANIQYSPSKYLQYLGSTKLYCLVTEARVNNLSKVAVSSVAARIQSCDLLIASRAP